MLAPSVPWAVATGGPPSVVGRPGAGRGWWKAMGPACIDALVDASSYVWSGPTSIPVNSPSVHLFHPSTCR
ncbi:hypothetical protein L228DRAFT_249275 [Xylona heveae TC161]|uniref:Uncharacterized protein n=1 Tax=Xylona heveae (strain CBS 132557 / TC161) TaxID=1328760 RepID=A0A165FW30_XYLHT|nr:hypothetical protein L228DRAFT_249275 [Xylona heveae TC161]KZF21451.1 hypothetical protein L228DRAFT_249275 [Xylona heveae TC161]